MNKEKFPGLASLFAQDENFGDSAHLHEDFHDELNDFNTALWDTQGGGRSRHVQVGPSKRRKLAKVYYT